MRRKGYLLFSSDWHCKVFTSEAVSFRSNDKRKRRWAVKVKKNGRRRRETGLGMCWFLVCKLRQKRRTQEKKWHFSCEWDEQPLLQIYIGVSLLFRNHVSSLDANVLLFWSFVQVFALFLLAMDCDLAKLEGGGCPSQVLRKTGNPFTNKSRVQNRGVFRKKFPPLLQPPPIACLLRGTKKKKKKELSPFCMTMAVFFFFSKETMFIIMRRGGVY